MNLKNFLKEHYLIILLVFFFLFYRIRVTLDFFSLIFDGAVYIGQAKYIYSFGAAGYFEPLRPLVLPLFLGIGWLAGFDTVVWGKTIEILFAAGTLVLVYIIASRLQNKIAGLLAAGFLAITPMFFLYSDKILTGIPSVFFALLSFYFFMNEKYWQTGLFASISFMTRFPQGILFIAYFLAFAILWLQITNKKNKKQVCMNFLQFIIPYASIAGIYLIFNAIKYRAADTVTEAMFWPFMHGAFTISTAGLWMYQGAWTYYFVELFNQNYLFIFSLVFIIFYVYEMRYKQETFNFLLIAPVLFLAYFTQLAHKEIRFALVLIAYLAILSGIALARIYGFVENRKRLRMIFFLIVLIVLFFMGLPTPSLTEYVSPSVSDICFFVHDSRYTGPIILTIPYPLHCLDNQIEMNLFSIPLLINTTRDNPDWMLIYAPETFVCPPNDQECNEEKYVALKTFSSSYDLLYFNNITELPIYVFKKPSSSGLQE